MRRTFILMGVGYGGCFVVDVLGIRVIVEIQLARKPEPR